MNELHGVYQFLRKDHSYYRISSDFHRRCFINKQMELNKMWFSNPECMFYFIVLNVLLNKKSGKVCSKMRKYLKDHVTLHLRGIPSSEVQQIRDFGLVMLLAN